LYKSPGRDLERWYKALSSTILYDVIHKEAFVSDGPNRSITAFFHFRTRCFFGRFWRVIPIDHELSVHESERLKCKDGKIGDW
jgi:hypothetical protein